MFFNKLFNLMFKKVKKEEIMSTKKGFAKVSLSPREVEFGKESSNERPILIAREGKRMLLKTKNGIFPVTKENVVTVIKEAELINENKKAVINCVGISRSQVGRIVGDIKRETDKDVVVRNINKRDHTGALLRYKLFVK